ncbi:hypothetical protein N657DRAFT_651322 [Parathielavia appendiculata]|uniref:Uncharacterized protein n=1 Tax=Parathielavia appendiculata TaxID=2587402 RepID=A0AAN6TPU5_9PEZI|nr:hypothetical protein N657DRAFT_651322 [Parathielavia appendiculata]
MEDEGYYHMMLHDMERLERIHHHVEVPDTASARPQRVQPYSPRISGLWASLDGAVKGGLERFHLSRAWHERKSDRTIDSS